jgi:hypothetical protein
MPARINETEAIARLASANLEPLEPYINVSTPWKCKCLKCGKTVTPTLNSISNNRGGCVYCAGNKVDDSDAVVLFEKNDLQPLVPFPGAGKPWRAIHKLCGKEVTPTYSNVRSGHTGCKFCAGNILDEEKARSFFVSVGLLPLDSYPGAHKHWRSIHQKCGREVQPTFNDVQQGSGGCKYCGGNDPLKPDEALKIIEPLQLKPLEPFRNTASPWKLLHTPCQKVVFPTLASIKSGNKGCRYCAKVFIDEADAVTQLRGLGYEPLIDYPGSSSPWKSIHNECGKVVSPYLSSIKRGSGCPYCTQQKVDPEDAKTLFLSKGLIPQVAFPGGKIGWKSIHAKCGEVVSPKYSDVRDGSGGCKHCAPNYVSAEDAVAIFKLAGFEPLVDYPGTEVGWKSIHLACGREVTPRFGYVKRNNAGCAYCAGKLVHPDEAENVMRLAGFKTLTPYPGSQTAWPSIHDNCGKEVSPQYASVRLGGGCKYCSNSTFNYEEPAVLYLITHEELGAHKVGIGGLLKGRLEQHKREGWLVYKTLNFETGDIAYDVEQQVLNWFVNDIGLFPFLSKQEMPQGGWTETVDATEIDLPTIWFKIEQLAKVGI